MIVQLPNPLGAFQHQPHSTRLAISSLKFCFLLPSMFSFAMVLRVSFHLPDTVSTVSLTPKCQCSQGFFSIGLPYLSFCTFSGWAHTFSWFLLLSRNGWRLNFIRSTVCQLALAVHPTGISNAMSSQLNSLSLSSICSLSWIPCKFPVNSGISAADIRVIFESLLSLTPLSKD